MGRGLGIIVATGSTAGPVTGGHITGDNQCSSSDASLRRVACDKINAYGGEQDTKSFAQRERFVKENQSEHGAAKR
jgi:hypothetical protein